MIPIPTEVLAKGENVITLTNDANVNDGWTAANVHLEIHGILTGPPVGALRTTMATPEATPPTTSPLAPLEATAIYSTGDVVLTSSYDGWDHYVQYHAPTDVNNVPLIVAIHGMGRNSQDMMDLLSTAVQSYTWALVAPDMHSMAIPNSGADALAWVGAQHDIVEAIEYMQSTFSIDPSRIYIVGVSMGGQTTTLMVAKYPDIFAAAAEWMGFTDVADWHTELSAHEAEGHDFWNLRARTEKQMSPDPGEYLTPTEDPFEYGRRSSMMMPLNMLRVPLKIWHDECDLVVDLHHSEDLANAINSVKPSTVDLETVNQACPSDPTIPPYGHCYELDPVELLDTLDGYTLGSNPPISLTIRTDESKPYYWLNMAQTGGDHWSEVEAAYSLANKTVTATISDTQPLTLAFNLGSTPIVGPGGVDRPGMGLPATTYLVKEGSNNDLHDYTSGYLTTTLLTTGWQIATSTITVVVQDHLGNPVPDGTTIQFSTTEGTFPNGNSTDTTTVTGGQVTTDLTLAAIAADLAEVTASVESITGSTSVNIIHPALEVAVTPSQTAVYGGQAVTYTYQILNTGDTTLTGVTLVDDNGTPGDSSDDITVCTGITLAAGATTSYSSSLTLTQTTTSTATVTGQDPLDNNVTGSDSTTVNVISPAIEVTIMPNQTTIYSEQVVTYTYRITNTGDVTLTAVTLIDDNGTPGDSSDDVPVYTGITLTAGATASCSRSVTLTQTTTNTATATGLDPLDNPVTSSASTTVSVISQVPDVKIYVPIVIRNKDSATRSVYRTMSSGEQWTLEPIRKTLWLVSDRAMGRGRR
jgi:pimeloyl-ACP methyl ester carboxylesterase